MAEAPARPHDRHGRRRPFSNWMKRLAILKGSSSDSAGAFGKRGNGSMMSKNKRNTTLKNNPYPLSGTVGASGSSRRNEYVSSGSSEQQYGHPSASQSSLPTSSSDNHIPGNSAKSTAPTLSTNGDTALSEATYSKAGTMATGGRGVNGGGEGSTFSSPAPSVRSLTTTLTTVQSTAPSTHIYGAQNGHAHNNAGLPHVNSTQSSASQQVQFSHQFPPSSLSAVPPHVIATSHPTTYSTATANNLLTDNASILTLASSSKRRRRNSLDTNASIRALAPSSIFGGSRESLPLSTLSANVGEASNASASGVNSRPSIGGLASAERASVYSSSGAAPMTSAGERSSYIASKQSGTGDSGSVRSGVHSHTRNDSAAGTVGCTLTNPAAGPQSATPGRISRRSSGWGELTGDDDEDGTGQTDQAAEEPDQAKEVPS
ncbi:hypothetical protein T310_0335 [Rasamsonia emersonii CBS 393.64]|uniref:Ca2+-modulated nonselective cation channel polycystin n=1 Tax=Rasamsonia emersonii (strain ATCC 16479 / CBS 393.64 / IMI 116815) TaxID=1408163 RepID=A0A0F4Z683_RASE3|nr:hypothetical protein T310_0335 [Rasamsonia emersonii CBS 393.64]KKA25606.1 hypothetical protein T310_0335 [Rasamsonia emersonii CBS 393.64]